MDTCRPGLTGSIWVGRFSARLMALQRSTSLVRVVRRAVATWPYASQVEPEAAADIYRARRIDKLCLHLGRPDGPLLSPAAMAKELA